MNYDNRIMPILSQQKKLRYIGSLPWGLLAPHEQQAINNHSQSLDTLARRGGLFYSEALAIIEDRRWRHIPDEEAAAMLEAKIAAYQEERFRQTQDVAEPNE